MVFIALLQRVGSGGAFANGSVAADVFNLRSSRLMNVQTRTDGMSDVRARSGLPQIYAGAVPDGARLCSSADRRVRIYLVEHARDTADTPGSRPCGGWWCVSSRESVQLKGCERAWQEGRRHVVNRTCVCCLECEMLWCVRCVRNVRHTAVPGLC